MGQGTLVNQQIEAGDRFLKEFQKYAPVQVAFWLQDDDSSEPWLYAASDQITDDNIDVGYEEVGRIADELQDPWFDLMRVKLIGADHALAKAATDLLRHYPSRSPIHLFARQFDGIYANEVYFYPGLTPTPVQ